MKRLCIYLFLVGFLTACSITGVYQYEKEHAILCLNNDHTFKYETRFGGHGEGLWKRRGRHIILTSHDTTPNKFKFDYKVYPTGYKDKIVFSVRIQPDKWNGNDYSAYFMRFNHDNFCQLYSKTNYSIFHVIPDYFEGCKPEETDTIHSIRFMVQKNIALMTKNGKYQVPNLAVSTETRNVEFTYGDSVAVTIHVTDSLFNTCTFKSDKFKFNRKTKQVWIPVWM